MLVEGDEVEFLEAANWDLCGAARTAYFDLVFYSFGFWTDYCPISGQKFESDFDTSALEVFGEPLNS